MPVVVRPPEENDHWFWVTSENCVGSPDLAAATVDVVGVPVVR